MNATLRRKRETARNVPVRKPVRDRLADYCNDLGRPSITDAATMAIGEWLDRQEGKA